MKRYHDRVCFVVDIPKILFLCAFLPFLLCPHISFAEGVMTDLGIGLAYGINNTGQVVGVSSRGAFLYSNGVMTDLGIDFAYDINDPGQVVGYSETSSGETHAFLYSNGVMTDLGIGLAHGINNTGQVVGYSKTSSGPKHAFFYSNGVMTDLGIGVAYGINNTGQVVGLSSRGAFLYSNGVMTDLGSGVAYDINDAGQVVGNSVTSSGEMRAFLYSNGVMTDLGTLGGTESIAFGINKTGQVVGYSETSSGETHAFLYSNGVMTDLGTFGGLQSLALDINDAGQVAGWFTTLSGSSYESHAFLYTPNPGTLPNVSITSQPLKVNDASDPLSPPFLPNVLRIMATVINNGGAKAEHVIVKFTLNGSTLLPGPIDLGSIESGETKPATIEWSASANVEGGTLEATVELVGQQDGDVTNNKISQVFSFYYAPFHHQVDAFSFENWGFSTFDDYYKEFNDYLIAQFQEKDIADIITAGLGGTVFSISGVGGHCYGMTSASASYYRWPEAKPVDKLTFSMWPEEAKPDIIERHWSMFLHDIELLGGLWDMVDGWVGTYSADKQYKKILSYVKNSKPIPIPLTLRGESWGGSHSVVAYKILDLGDDDKRVYVYDPNGPYDAPDDVYTPLPGHIKKNDNAVRFNPISNKASFGEYDKAWPVEPWQQMSPEEIFVSIKKALGSSFRQLWEKGLSVLRFKSPVTGLLTDESGRRIGYVGATFVNEIPGAAMEDQLGSQIFYLPLGFRYVAIMTGTGEGTLGIDIVTPTSEDSARITLFKNIPVTIGMHAEILLDPTYLTYQVVMESGQTVTPIRVGEINSSDIIGPTSLMTLAQNVNLYFSIGWLKNASVRDGLLDKVSAAHAALDRGQPEVVKKILRAFINQMQSGSNVDKRAQAYLSACIAYLFARL